MPTSTDLVCPECGSENTEEHDYPHDNALHCLDCGTINDAYVLRHREGSR